MILDFSEKFLKTLLFIILALFCYLYTFYGSDFAEWTIRLHFLDFPIFVGESLLFIVFLLCGLYYLKFPKKVNKKIFVVIAAYACWILIKAIPGYFQSGPLALRNAALFYYPFYALASYTMFDRGIYKGILSKTILLFLLLNLFFAPISDYFVPSYWLLTLGFSLTLRPLWFRATVFLMLAAHSFYTKFFFIGSRSHMIGIGLMVVFLIGYFILGFLGISWRKKLIAMVSVVLLIVLGLGVFGDKNALRSMLTFSHLREQYAVLDVDIQRKKEYYVQPELSPNIYFQNRENLLTENLFGYSYCPSGNAATTDGTFKSEDVRAIHDSAKDFMEKTSTAKESVIYERANNIYKEAKAILEQQNSIVIEQAQKDLDQEIQKLVQESNFEVEKDLEEALQNLSLALRHETERSVDELKKSVDDASQSTILKLKQKVRQKQSEIVANILTQKADRSLEVAYNNIFFRLFIWRDMIEELKTKSAWWGVGFGHPQRSISIEILDWASVEWRRDGWITPHNSFLHMIYRGGIIGVFCVVGIVATIIYLAVGFVRCRSVWGGLLISIIMYWIGISNFLVFLELPHTAIPFWTFFGMTIAYYHSLGKGKISHA